MGRSSSRLSWLCTSTAILAFAGAAYAQPPEPAVAGDELLGEVVVTATRQSDTVNRVPLSVSAVTQRALDQQGIKDVQDLARNVPSVQFTRAGADSAPQVAIRGIRSGLGAPTTGVYLDDVPVQKRDTNGAVTGNGSPYPQLFDLERVEILRGPQGTLYGGSAQGGAIRFITPTPSLTRYSGFARTEVSNVDEGGWSYEAGVGVGGPIIPDKLGFRASVWGRHTAGTLDHVSIYTGQQFAEDSNWRKAHAIRLSVLWQPTENLRITPAFYNSYDKFNNNDIFWEDVPQITLASGIFTNRGTTQSGVQYDFPDTVFTGGTFGPFNQFGPHTTPTGFYATTTGTPVLVTSPRKAFLNLPSLTIDYDFGWVTAKSITALIEDTTRGSTAGGLGHRAQVLPTTTNAQFVRTGSVGASCAGAATSSITDDGVCRTPIPGGVGATALFIPGFPQRYANLFYDFDRDGISQELRFASRAGASPLSFVVGGFYSLQNYRQTLYEPGNEEPSAIFLRGVGEEWFMGQTNTTPLGQPLPVGTQGVHAFREQFTREEELAAFGEFNYQLTEKLKATAGARYSKTEVEYTQYTGGSVFGNVAGFVGTPAPPARITNPNQGHPFANQPGDPIFNVISGKQTGKPFSPKLGLSYQANSQDLYYASYSTGYRTGGVNQPAPPGNCAPTLAALGITTTPLDYQADKVINYEVGAKVRLPGNIQVNSSLFYIDWKNPQIAQRLTQCGHTYIDNAGSAVSKGVDIQAVGRFGPFSFGVAVAYTDAKYTETVLTPVPPGTPPQTVVSNGDEIGSPKWQFSLNSQYDFVLNDALKGYVRADYQYQGEYKRSPGPPSFNYNAVTYKGKQTHNVNARAGLMYGNIEAAVFVNNVTNEDTRLNVTNTAPTVLVTSVVPRPREVGLQVAYRF